MLRRISAALAAGLALFLAATPVGAAGPVTGLSSHVKYQFRVAAKNLWGVGTYSAVITRTAG